MGDRGSSAAQQHLLKIHDPERLHLLIGENAVLALDLFRGGLAAADALLIAQSVLFLLPLEFSVAHRRKVVVPLLYVLLYLHSHMILQPADAANTAHTPRRSGGQMHLCAWS